jgi:hypothetical protein
MELPPGMVEITVQAGDTTHVQMRQVIDLTDVEEKDRTKILREASDKLLNGLPIPKIKEIEGNLEPPYDPPGEGEGDFDEEDEEDEDFDDEVPTTRRERRERRELKKARALKAQKKLKDDLEGKKDADEVQAEGEKKPDDGTDPKSE